LQTLAPRAHEVYSQKIPQRCDEDVELIMVKPVLRREVEPFLQEISLGSGRIAALSTRTSVPVARPSLNQTSLGSQRAGSCLFLEPLCIA
jgi:hypothetical protein